LRLLGIYIFEDITSAVSFKNIGHFFLNTDAKIVATNLSLCRVHRRQYLRKYSGEIYEQKKNSVALVRKRTERPPLVGEVSANFCG
jgi:hypothetical protein